MRIRTYTMTVNVNHAPHVREHEGRPLLSLANCKPGIRRKAKQGEWIAAITPKKIGYRLAYLFRVGGGCDREDYWKKFTRSRLDSIYKPSKDGSFELLANPFHDENNKATDLSCNRVLWSYEFYYFATPYGKNDSSPHGLYLHPDYKALERSIRTEYGYFIEVPDDFEKWVKKQFKKQPNILLGESDTVVCKSLLSGGSCCRRHSQLIKVRES